MAPNAAFQGSESEIAGAMLKAGINPNKAGMVTPKCATVANFVKLLAKDTKLAALIHNLKALHAALLFKKVALSKALSLYGKSKGMVGSALKQFVAANLAQFVSIITLAQQDRV